MTDKEIWLNFWVDKQKNIDIFLNRYLRKMSSVSTKIREAVIYSVIGGGKRFRPVLVLASAETCGLKSKKILPVAVAVELIHCYSLIHDDLPAMDNDDYRRGKLTCHKKFGEAIAILAGDALLTKAFELVTELKNMISADIIVKVIKEISIAAGMSGMVGGQVLDILSMNNVKKMLKNKPEVRKYLYNIHAYKTAALIKMSAKIGAMISGASQSRIRALEKYGEKVGLAFQIQDDLLDCEQDGGKKFDQLTYPLIYGIENSRQKAKQLINEAKKEIKIFGNRAKILNGLANFVIERSY